ncbi:NnrS family protein [Chitinibacter sp. SCUT-21]|uniref:NnrS family protein n=1 Tax=Chitinibacter sp. SCUT-21 TaxID=2970891 RepID=UPI0035A72FE2
MNQRLSTLFCTPHRLGFFCGAAVLIASLALWTFEMISRSGGLALAGTVPAMLWHGYVMIYGFFPLFMLGFIYTAGPRWLNVSSPTRRQYIPAIIGFSLGTIATLTGRWSIEFLQAGAALGFCSWVWAITIWWNAIKRSSAVDKIHAYFIGTAFALGALGMLFANIWLFSSNANWWLASIHLGIWGFLLPVFLTVSHRMIPFFSANVLKPYQAWRPNWLLYTWGGLLAVNLIFKLLQLNTLLISLFLTLLFLYTSWRWRLFDSFQIKLLAMLHMAFAWTGISLILFTINDALVFLGYTGLGFAPLHALTIGFFCTMLLAFVTRVTLGHSGRPLIAGGVAWITYWTMHGATLARVTGEIWPTQAIYWYTVAAIFALASLLSWSRVYLPMYWQARIDGQKG